MAATSQTPSIAAASTLQSEENFRLLDLPPELREEIYYQVMGPHFPVIDTAAIPGTPDRVVIPSIAQVSQQLRNETLAVFYRNRPVEVSSYCDDNVLRAHAWAKSWAGHAKDFTTIIFKGKMRATGYEFFHLTVGGTKTAPYFTVCARPGVSEIGDAVLEHMVLKAEVCLTKFGKDMSTQQRGRLTAGQFAMLINLAEQASQYDPSRAARRKRKQ